MKMKAKLDPERCQEMIWAEWHLRQCMRKIWKDGKCHSHHPEKVEARNQKANEAYRIKQVARNRPYVRAQKLEAENEALKIRVRELEGQVEDLEEEVGRRISETM